MASRNLRSVLSKASLAYFLLVCLAAPLCAQTPSFEAFDAPDAGTQKHQGTVPISINDHGMGTGWYVDSAGSTHGFFRTDAGSITEFDAPGLTGTSPVAINLSNQIVGTGIRTSGQISHTHGFLRNQNGLFAAVDVPGAMDTWPSDINDGGEIIGFYDDAANVFHGFARDPTGVFTAFDAPGAGNNFGDGTSPTAINTTGLITGYVTDANFARHGFVRDQFGNITTFDDPNAGNSGHAGTSPLCINASGEVAGTYLDNSLQMHSFIRDTLGNMIQVDMPNALQTGITAIDDRGLVVGQVKRGTQGGAFRRDPLGNFGLVIVPVEDFSSGANDVTNSGRIWGFYTDSQRVNHGFVKRVQTQ